MASEAEGKRKACYAVTPGLLLEVDFPAMRELLLWLCPRADRSRLISGSRRDVRNVRSMRDLAALGVGDLNAGMIEQKAGSAIQFDLSFFVGCFGGDKRDFGLRSGQTDSAARASMSRHRAHTSFVPHRVTDAPDQPQPGRRQRWRRFCCTPNCALRTSMRTWFSIC